MFIYENIFFELWLFAFFLLFLNDN